jgi:hypothetical protein
LDADNAYHHWYYLYSQTAENPTMKPINYHLICKRGRLLQFLMNRPIFKFIELRCPNFGGPRRRWSAAEYS